MARKTNTRKRRVKKNIEEELHIFVQLLIIQLLQSLTFTGTLLHGQALVR